MADDVQALGESFHENIPLSKNAIELLMQGPLVAWVRAFVEEEKRSLDYGDLVNGAFLDDLLSRIDPRPGGSALQPAEDVCTRIRNLDNVVRSVKSFYEDILGQLILVRLPDPVILGRDPDSDISLAGMQLLLLLILGCAVQGPNKEAVIEDIKKLPIGTQHAIVECIQQVADNPECVWSKEWNEFNSVAEEQQESLYRILVQHVRRLVQERDEYAQQATTLILRDLSQCGSQNNTNHNRHHSMVELAEAKARLRRCRQQVEEKCEQAAELREELDDVKSQLAKVKQENMDLVQEARLSKALRDELDIVRERASKVDRLEAELNRYKDKLNDIDYYKARLEEFREDNRLLEETKTILEGQLDNARQRAELVLELEAELLNYKTQLNSLMMEKDADKERIKKLVEENAHWQLCTKNCLSESASLVAELDSIRTHQSDGNKDSLGEQISTVDLQNKTRRLEMENQRLVSLLSNVKESHFRENAERILQLEAENTKLKLKVENLERDQRHGETKLTELLQAATVRTTDLERQRDDLQQRYQELKSSMELAKVDRCKMEEYELQLVTQTAENQKLQRSADLLQKKMETLQSESRDLEAENSKLQKTVESLRNSLRRLNELEKENTDLETDNHRLDRENKGLHKEIARLKQAIEVKDGNLDEYSSKLSTLEREHKRIQKEYELYQNQSLKLRELERENKEMQQTATVEHKTLTAIREELVQEKIKCQQLQCQLDTNLRTLEHVKEDCQTLKIKNEELIKNPIVNENIIHPQTLPGLEIGREVIAIKDRLVELERENAVLSVENTNMKSSMSSQKEQVAEAQSQLTVISQQLAMLQVENSTLSSQWNSVSTQNATLQATVEQLESEKENLVQQLELSQHRLEQLSRDQEELQTLHEQLQSEYDTLLGERENLKAVHRELKLELRSVNEKLEAAVHEEQSWKDSQVAVHEELEKLRSESRSLGNLRAEHSRLKDDFRSLFVANEKLKTEYKGLQGDYKTVRGDHNSLKLKHTQLQGEMAECRHQVTNLDVELSKLNNKCEVLQQWNTTLEEDKRNLVNQVSVLLTQYHELLSQTLEDKDHFHEETKNFSDKLNHLKRQKEILEDKIMEQYRRMENSTPLKKNSKASIGALFVRKMRRASSELINRVPRSRSRSRGPLGSDRDSPDQADGPDSFSLESGSNSGSNSGCGSLDGGSGGEGDHTPTNGTRQDRDRIRQSMPIINYDHQESVLRSSFSSDVLCSTTIVETENNANSCVMSSCSINGNSSQPSSNGNIPDLPTTSVNVNSSSASPSMTSHTSQSATLVSNGLHSSILNSPYLLSKKPSSFNEVERVINGSTTSLLLSSPTALKLISQSPSRSVNSLSLLDRAGSRQPLCIAEVDPTILDSANDNTEIILSRDAGLQSGSKKNTTDSPRKITISPANSDISESSKTTKAVARIPVQSTGTSPPPPVGAGNLPNGPKLVPNLTSTTRINVNITTPSSPTASNLERRGSLRLPPRPAPRSSALATEEAVSVTPPLPARISIQEQRPTLPPRPNNSANEDKSAELAASSSTGASSIWYEYGCV